MAKNENRDENHTFFGSHIKPREVFICILNGLQRFLVSKYLILMVSSKFCKLR